MNVAFMGPVLPASAQAPDVLARAKDLYASAAYEEALQLLAAVKDSPAAPEVSAYKVFCLMALGRRDEARAALAETVNIRHGKLAPGDKKAVIDHAMRVLENEGFFDSEAGGSADAGDFSEAEEQ